MHEEPKYQFPPCPRTLDRRTFAKFQEIYERSPEDFAALEVLADMIIERMNDALLRRKRYRN